MKKHQKFFHAKLNRAITLACAGAMGISMTASGRLLAATTLGSGESITIGSGNSIDATDDSGVVVSGVVAGDIAVQSAGSIDVDAADGFTGDRVGGIVVVAEGESAGVGDIANSGSIGANLGASDGADVWGIGLDSESHGAGTTTLTVDSITNSGSINTSSGEGADDTNGITFSGGTEGAGVATIDVGSVLNQGSITTTVTAGPSLDPPDADGMEFYSEAGGTGVTTIDVGSVINSGTINASGGEYVAGIGFDGEGEDAGTAIINVGSVLNSGVIEASEGMAGTGGIGFGSNSGMSTTEAAVTAVDVGSVINEGAITATDSPEDVMGIGFRSKAEGAGNATVTVTGGVTNRGGITASIGAGLSPTGEDWEALGITFSSTSEETGDTTTTVNSVTNESAGVITVSGGYEATGIRFSSDADDVTHEDAGSSTMNVGSIINNGTITARDASEAVSGIHLDSESEGAGNATLTLGNLTNEGAITITTGAGVSPDEGGLYSMGIAFGSEADLAEDATVSVGGNVTATITGSVTNSGSIESIIDPAIGSEEKLFSAGIVFYANAEEGTGNATTTINSVTNESTGAITASGGDSAWGMAFAINVDDEYDTVATTTGDVTINVGSIFNAGAIAASDGFSPETVNYDSFGGTAGIGFFGETESTGGSAIRVDSLTNEGSISATITRDITVGFEERLGVMGIGFTNESNPGNAIIELGSLTNRGDITATVNDGVTVDATNFDVQGVVLDNWNESTGDATIDVIGGITNEGRIAAAIGGNITLNPPEGERVSVIGMDFSNESEGDGGNAAIGMAGLTNRGEITATANDGATIDANGLSVIGIGFDSWTVSPGDASIDVVGGITNEGRIEAAIGDGITLDSAEGGSGAGGIVFRSYADDTGDAASRMTGRVINRGSIASSVAANTDASEGELSAAGIVLSSGAGDSGNSITSVDGVINESTGAITASGGDSAWGMAFLTNLGSAWGRASLAGSGSEEDAEGDATLEVGSILNAGSIAASDGLIYTVGIGLRNETGSAGDAAIDVGGITNEGDIAATITRDVTVGNEGEIDVMGIGFDNASEGAGGATTELGGLTNRGTITAIVEDGVTVDTEDFEVLGIEFDNWTKGMGDTAIHVTGDITNEGDISAIVDDGVTIDTEDLDVRGIWFDNSTDGVGNATIDVTGDITNEGRIDATIGNGVIVNLAESEESHAVGIGFHSYADGAGDATVRATGSIINRGDITSSVADSLSGNSLEKLYAAGLVFWSSAEDSGNALVSVGGVTNESGAAITASGGDNAWGMVFLSEVDSETDAGGTVTGNSTLQVGSILNAGTIVASGGVDETTGIKIEAESHSAGNATVTITGDISNTSWDSITSDGHGISLTTSATGTGSASVDVGGALINTGAIRSVVDGHGIHVGPGVTITGGIENSGLIAGAGASGHAIYMEDGADVPTLSLSGDSARLVGNIRAPNSALTLSGQSDGSYFTTEGAFSVDSFTIAPTGAFEISNDGYTVTAPGGFTNQGALRVAPGVTAQITGDYSQTGDGVYVTGVGVENGAIIHGTLVVSGDVDSNNKLAVDVSDDAGELLAVSEGGDIGIVLTYGGTSVNTDGMAIVDNTSVLDFTAVDDNSGNIQLVAVVDEVSYLEQAVEKATGEATGATGERIMAETVPFGGGLTRAETGAQRERKEANKNTLVIQGYDNKARASMDYADLEIDGVGGWSTGFVASYSHTLENDSEFRINAPYRYTSMADADDTQSHFIGLDVAYLWPLRKGEGWHWDVGGDVFGSAYFLKSDALDLKRSGNVRYGAGLWTSYTTKLPRAPGMVSVGLDTKVSETFSPSSMISTGNENLDREIVDAVAELDPVATVTYGLNYGLPFHRDKAVVNLEVIRSEFISDDIDGDRDAQTRVNLSGSYHLSDTFEINAGLYEVYGLKNVRRRGLMLGILHEF